MLCYKDKTFCASEGPHSCGREITKAEEEEAVRMELPVAYGNFCETNHQ